MTFNGHGSGPLVDFTDCDEHDGAPAPRLQVLSAHRRQPDDIRLRQCRGGRRR